MMGKQEGVAAGQVWIVLAMHGAPPKDFPGDELGELMRLHMQLEHMRPGEPRRGEAEAKHRELDARMRAWPRTEANDPFHAASHRLAAELRLASGCPVVLGFNEFCAPDIGRALDEAAGGAARVVVITPMMTAGGEHAEVELPAHVRAARQRHPRVEFVYAWPYEPEAVAQFLAQQAARFKAG